MNFEWCSKYIDRDEFYSYLVGSGVGLFYFIGVVAIQEGGRLFLTSQDAWLTTILIGVFSLLGTALVYGVYAIEVILLHRIKVHPGKKGGLIFYPEYEKLQARLVHLPAIVSSGFLVLSPWPFLFQNKFFQSNSLRWWLSLVLLCFGIIYFLISKRFFKHYKATELNIVNNEVYITFSQDKFEMFVNQLVEGRLQSGQK